MGIFRIQLRKAELGMHCFKCNLESHFGIFQQNLPEIQIFNMEIYEVRLFFFLPALNLFKILRKNSIKI